MKRRICIILITLCTSLFLLCLMASAETDGIFTYTVTDGVATITACSQGGEVVVPSTIGDYPVIAIGDQAFAGTAVTSVTISEGIETIGEYAFYDCEALTGISLPDSLTFITRNAFYECTALKEVVLPDGLTSIEYGTFYWCSSLESVTVPETVTTIGMRAFIGCDSLATVNFLGSQAQWKSITVGEYNEALSSATVTFAKEDEEPPHFTYTLSDGNVTITGTSLSGDIEIPSQIDGYPVTSIGEYAFINRSDITSVTLPEGVTSVGRSAFWNCSALTSVKLPSTLKALAYEMFADTALTGIVIPDGVSEIPAYAFYSCESLKSITIPATVTSVGCDAFIGCSSLETVTFTGTQTQWNNIDVYAQGNGYLTSATVICQKIEVEETGWAIDYILRGTATIDNVAKTLSAVWDKTVSKENIYLRINLGANDTMTVSDIEGGTVTVAARKYMTITPALSNVSFKVTITAANGDVTVLDAEAYFGYPEMTIDSTLVTGVTRCVATVSGTTVSATSNVGKTSKMQVKFNLPEGGVASFKSAQEYALLEGSVLTLNNPGSGILTVPVVLTDAKGGSLSIVVKADFDNAVTYRTTGSVAQTGNNLTFTSGNTTMYVVFASTGIEGAYIEVENLSRNLLNRYVIVSDTAMRFYNPFYDTGTLTVNVKNADGETVKSYNITMIFNTKEYKLVTAALRCTYEIDGDTIIVTADEGASNIFVQLGKYYSETLYTEGADEDYVVRFCTKEWKIYRSPAPLEFDVLYVAEGGDVITRHIVINF